MTERNHDTLDGELRIEELADRWERSDNHGPKRDLSLAEWKYYADHIQALVREFGNDGAFRVPGPSEIHEWRYGNLESQEDVETTPREQVNHAIEQAADDPDRHVLHPRDAETPRY